MIRTIRSLDLQLKYTYSMNKMYCSQYSQNSTSDKTYPGEHIPTNLFQKSLLTIGSTFVAITAPWRGDSIATLGETTGHYALKYMRTAMQHNDEGKQILSERPRINTKSVDIKALSLLPPNTMGRVYYDWLQENRVNPDERPVVHFVDDPDLAYIMVRYREIHDLSHALLGMPTHFLGEVTIKWIEGLQTGLPMCLTGGLFGALRLRPKQRKYYFDSHLKFALENGYKGKMLMNCYFEKRWHENVDDIRKEFNLTCPPDTPKKIW